MMLATLLSMQLGSAYARPQNLTKNACKWVYCHKLNTKINLDSYHKQLRKAGSFSRGAAWRAPLPSSHRWSSSPS